MFPELIKSLKGENESNYAIAIDVILGWARDNYVKLEGKGQKQDPWMIVNIVQRMVMEVSEPTEKMNLPMLECECKT